MKEEPTVFLDGICSVCGRHCGNGGRGYVLRCDCGWVGLTDDELLRAIRALAGDDYDELVDRARRLEDDRAAD